MGKATRWLKGLLGKIRSSDASRSPSADPCRSISADPSRSISADPSRSPSASHRPAKERKRWSLLKSNSPPSNPAFRRAGASTASALRFHSPPPPVPPKYEANEHAIAVAAASAAAAQAAVAAAQAAADVVRLTSSGRCYPDPPAHASFGTVLEAWAALVIQSHFRGYLARRALRALKGLVKLQALVRGHILRKKTAETMRSIQAMLRAQERARSIRAYESPNSSDKSSQTYQRGPPTPEKFEQISYNRNTKSTQSAMPKVSGSRTINRVIIPPDQRYLNSGWSESQLDEPMWAARGRYLHYRKGASSGGEDKYIGPDKTLEIDAQKPTCLGPKRRKNMFESIGLDFASDQLTHSFTTTSKEDPTAHPVKQSTQDEDEEVAFCTAENSPQCHSSLSKGSLSSRKQSPMTPAKSDASASSCVSSYSDCPSYMAYTESSRAKMRSLSAPRQRPQGPQQQCQEKAGSTKRCSVHQQRAASSSASSAAMQACNPSKAYAGSGRLDKVGAPIKNNATVYYSGRLE